MIWYSKYIAGGIPPDEDHKRLFHCAFNNCGVTQHNEPLIIAAADDKMVSLCRFHYNLLCSHMLYVP